MRYTNNRSYHEASNLTFTPHERTGVVATSKSLFAPTGRTVKSSHSPWNATYGSSAKRRFDHTHSFIIVSKSPPRSGSRAIWGIIFMWFFDFSIFQGVLCYNCDRYVDISAYQVCEGTLLPMEICCQGRNRDNMFNSEELWGYLVPFRFNKAPHIVQN